MINKQQEKEFMDYLDNKYGDTYNTKPSLIIRRFTNIKTWFNSIEEYFNKNIDYTLIERFDLIDPIELKE